MYFKEKVPNIYKASTIIIILIIASIFISVSLLTPSNYHTLPFTISISILLLIYSCYYLYSHSKIGILEDYISVFKAGRYKGMLDIEEKIKIINGNIHIPYNEIEEIQVCNNKVYLKYKGLLGFISLEPTNLDKFLSVLKNKITEKNLNIPLKVEDVLKDNFFIFKNNVLTNIPTIIGFTIIMAFPNIVGIYNLIKDGFGLSFFFELVTFIVTIALYYTIFAYQDLIIFSDNELINLTKLGNITIDMKKIPYNKIKSVRNTKWRVDLKTSSGYIYFAPSEKDKFYKIISARIKS